MPRRIGRRVGETVAGAAIKQQAPVEAGRLHLALEGGALLGRDDRVLGADVDQHLALDVPGGLRSRGREAGMEADDRLEVAALAAELERRRAAETVADGGQPTGIDFLLRLQHVERRRGTGHDAGRIGDPGGDLRPHLGQIGMRLALTVVVHGEAGIAQPGQPRGDLLGVLGEAWTFVDDQNAGAARGRAVVDHVLADHANAVGPVLDVLGAHPFVSSVPGCGH